MTALSSTRLQATAAMGGVLLALSGLLISAAKAPTATLLVSIGACVATFLARTNAGSDKTLIFVLVGSSILFTRNPGHQWYEILFGPIFYIYIFWFFFAKATNPKEKIIHHWTEILLVTFVAWSSISLLWGAQRSTVNELIGDLRSVLNLMIYFPVREAAKDPRRHKQLIISCIAIAMIIATRNFLDYRSIVVEAIASWQKKNARVVTNEVILLFGSIISMCAFIFQNKIRGKILYMAIFAISLTGLILTQSRAFWVDFAVSVLFVFAFLPRDRKISSAYYTVIVSISLYLLILWYFGPSATTTMIGLASRLASLDANVMQDISLMSRIYEAKAVMELFWQNPIVGYGIGARYSVYEIIEDVTLTRSFIHNGYVGLLFKAGLFGAVIHLSAWAGWIVLGVRAVRQKAPWDVLAATAVLVALLPSASTAMHVYSPDISLVFGWAAGWMMGGRVRSSAQIL